MMCCSTHSVLRWMFEVSVSAHSALAVCSPASVHAQMVHIAGGCAGWACTNIQLGPTVLELL